MEGGGAPMPDNPELDRYWAGQIDQKLQGLAEQFERERSERIAQFTEDRKERRQYNEGVRNVIEAQTEAVRTLTAKVDTRAPRSFNFGVMSMSFNSVRTATSPAPWATSR
jgi:hypothetical protein